MAVELLSAAGARRYPPYAMVPPALDLCARPAAPGRGQCLRRFLKKNLPFQDVGAGLIKMSYLGNAGWRFNRASTACIAALPSEMPLLYTLQLSLTTG